jgi:geranylgeranyl diphosphate synthase type I
MHALKTASYTARGPLLVGAILAGAGAPQRGALERFARPLGIAFQLRDDLLGTFGDPRATGKPAGTDLVSGKRTALVLELERDGEARALASRVLGVAVARKEDVAALVELLDRSGARARVEARLEALTREALRELDAAPLAARGKAVLAPVVKALCARES